jgi:hypothetical protein
LFAQVGREVIRGFRLPSARLSYEPYQHQAMDACLVLGQATPMYVLLFAGHGSNAARASSSDAVRLQDVLTDDNYSSQPMIELIGKQLADERAARANRSYSTATTPSPSKLPDYKDWRGKITHGNLPE